MPPARRRAPVLAALLAVPAAAAVFVAAGCSDEAGAGGRVSVVATTTQLADFAREVGGDRVDVHRILNANSDPHDYEPRPSDLVATARADVVLTSGDGLDAWMGEVVEQSGGDPEVVDVGATVPHRLPGDEEGEEASAVDPHWWHDPRNAEAAVKTITETLARIDGADAAVLRSAGEAYRARLARMDRGVQACLRAVPPARRLLVTDHDAFGYFARRYGIRVVGAVIPAQTTQAQPSAGDVAALVRTIRRTGVRAVFPESSVSPRLAEAVARETGATARYRLYGDTLGPDGSDGATYVGMVLHNADAVVRGFTGGARGCSVPGLG